MRNRAGGRRSAGFSPAAGLLLLAALLVIASLIWLLGTKESPAPVAPELASPAELYEPVMPEQLGSMPEVVLDRAEPAEIREEPVLHEPYSLLNSVDRIRDLHGIVLQPDGQPCANAVVLVQKPWSQGRELHRNEKIQERIEVGRARTNAAGEWKWTVNPGTWYEVEAKYDKWIAPPVLQCQAGERIDIRLSEPGVIHGVVTAAQGGAALTDIDVGAILELQDGGWVLRHKTLTQLDGRYRLEGLEPGFWHIGIDSPRHEYASESLQLEAGQTIQQDYKLEEGLVCHGQILDDETGLPIPRAEVSRWYDFDHHAVSDQQGQFVLPGIPRTEESDPWLVLDVRASGYSRRRIAPKEWDPSDSIEIRLTRGITVTGRVLLANSTPAAGAYVAIVADKSEHGIGPNNWEIAMTSHDGSFTIWDVRSDLDPSLVIRRPGSATLHRELPDWTDQGDKRDLGTIQLFASGTIAGQVLAEDGSVLAHCEVWCRGSGEDRLLWTPEFEYMGGSSLVNLEGRTDDLGRFRFTDISPGKYSIGGQAAGFCYPRRGNQDGYVELKEGETRENLRIVLKPGMRVKGKVVDHEGNPVEGAILTLNGTQPNPDLDFERSGREGEFLFYDVPPGIYRLVFDPQFKFQDLKGHAVYARYDRPDVVVEVGMKDLRVKLERTDTITGAVTDLDGRPALAIVGALNAAGELIVEAPTSADGRFELRMLEGLTVNLVARFADPGSNADLPEESRPRARFDAIPVGARDIQLRIPGRP